MAERDYETVAGSIAGRLHPGATIEERMQATVDELWSAFSRQGVSWCGFYVPDGSGQRLLLGPRRDTPACSPIELHGVCGRAFREGAPQLVDDVRDLGPDYIACDARDRSEVVVPVLAAGGSCLAVLDLDSHAPSAFSATDVEGLKAVLRLAGLSPPQGRARVDL